MKLKITYPVSDTTSVHCRSRSSIVVLSIVSFLLLLNIVYVSAGAIIRWNAFCKFSLNILTTNIYMEYSIILRIGRIQSDWVYFTYADFKIDICQFILKLIFHRI